MPEIKHNFTGGKMNKDVDQRLVPKGEYRDAMNIQVSTSEGSDVGTVQNILGNSAIVDDLGIALGSICVGAVADEKNDALYWFVREPMSSYNTTIAESRDIIFELKNGNITHVFVDKKQISIGVDTLQQPASGDIVMSSLVGFNAINVGDTFQLWQLGVNISGNEFYTVLSKDPATLKINIGDYTNASWAGTQAQGSGELQIVPFGTGGVLKFPENIITGINIIDDMLFWTDGATEPKKINIPRSIEGTFPNGSFHTRLINPAQNISYGSGILTKEEHVTVIRKGPDKAPTISGVTSFRSGNTFGYITSGSMVFSNGTQPLSVGSIKYIAIDDVNGDGMSFEPGDILRFSSDNAELAPQYFEIRASVLNVEDGPYTSGAFSASGAQTAVKIEIESMSSDGLVTSINPSLIEWSVGLEEVGKTLFERKLPRFSTRYKYTDGEYSSIGPFTEVVFIPGDFRYHPSEAYNTGMVNKLRELTIQDFIPDNIPGDVVQVDILYKNEMSPNIYTVESVSRLDTMISGENAWTAPGSAPGLFGSYKVSSENIYATLPSNQILRPWDNVPKKALAQEITGSRIVYGNYTQNYDLKFEGYNEIIKPNIQTTISGRTDEDDSNRGKKSIKSMRTYDVGLVWGDKYGRETPIITPSSGSTKVPKSKSTRASIFNVEVGDTHPDWAEYYKLFIKETSNEYYNLAMDRLYDAEDGNVWISVPSIDRNKVDEDTYIILKKGIDTEDAVYEEARYKIVAIENEAPEYIKTTYGLLAESVDDAAAVIHSAELYGGENPSATGTSVGDAQLPSGGKNAPIPGVKGFSISIPRWTNEWYAGNDTSNTPSNMGLPRLDKLFSDLKSGSEEMWVDFTRADDDDPSNPIHGSSGRYRITQLLLDDSDQDYDSSDFYEIKLHKPVTIEDGFITDDLNVGNDLVRVHFWKKSIENSPEFDGRFFIKILRDSIVDDNLINYATTVRNWTITSSTQFHRLKDSSLDETHANSFYQLYQPLGDYPTSYPSGGNPPLLNSASTTRTKAQWQELLKFGDSSLKSKWFIDGASFASVMPNTSELINQVSTKQSIGGHKIATSDTTDDVDYIWWGTGSCSNSSYTSNQNTGTGISRGVLGMKGVHEDSGHYYFDFGYSVLGPQTSGSSTNFTVGEDDGNSPTNSTTDEEESIVSRLTPNSRFKIEGDPTIYRIHSVSKRRLFNWRGYPTVPASENAMCTVPCPNYDPNCDCSDGWVPCCDCNGPTVEHWEYHTPSVYWNQESEQHKPYNRRKTYRIRYQVDTLSLPNPDLTISGNGWSETLPDNPAFTSVYASGVDAGSSTNATIQFVAQFDSDLPNVISNNPAIFETEPKEDVDLDIYYEATSSIPTKISKHNKELFIPIGATLEVDPAIQDYFSEGIFVTGWEGMEGVVLSTILTSTQVQLLAETYPEVKFVKDDGSYIEVTITVGLYDGVNYYGLQFNPNNFGKIGLGWFNCWSFNNGVESNRIGDTYNKPYITNGVKVSSVISGDYKEEERTNGLIYSGIYNPNSNINNLNQFIAAEKITKDINPTYGSIQKLYAGWGQGGDLIALCEDRVLKILANKDALYNADGNTNVTSTNNVLGQAIPYSGEYGISKNPESFASEAYRIYFTDKVRGTVMRLSMDGLTPISNHGMKDWFRDNLKLGDKLIGSYDDKKDEYNITVKGDTIAKTVTFKEDVKGWVSFKSFIPENAISCANEYYTFKDGNIWKHHDEFVNRNTFYNTSLLFAENFFEPSSVEVIFNEVPGSVKSFKTVNYEGSQAKVTSKDENGVTLVDGEYFNLSDVDGWHVIAKDGVQGGVVTNLERGGITEFINKEGKWFGYVIGDDVNISNLGNISDTSNYDTGDFSIQGVGRTANVVSSIVFGCMDDGGSTNLDVFGDGSNVVGVFANPSVPGTAAFNYISAATNDDGSCVDVVMGCIDPIASNTDGNANTDDGTCLYPGCTTPLATITNEIGGGGSLNFDPNANFDDGSCIMATYGCTLVGFANTNIFADFGSAILQTAGTFCGWENCMCIPFNPGCTDPNASNPPIFVDELTDVNTDDGSCVYNGCTDPLSVDYDPMFVGSTVDGPNGSLTYLNGTAVDDGSCTYVGGCMDAAACNYDPAAVIDDGSCSYCGDPDAENFTAPNDLSCVTNCEYCAPISNIQILSQTTSDVVGAVDQMNGTAVISFSEPANAYGAAILFGTWVIDQANSITTSTGWGSGTITFTATGLGVGTLNLPTVVTCPTNNTTNAWATNAGIVNPPLIITTTATPVVGCIDDGSTYTGGVVNPAGGEWGACNFDLLANADASGVIGGTDYSNCNYTDCVGCDDQLYVEYCGDCWDSLNFVNGPPGSSYGPWVSDTVPTSCTTLIVYGCTDSTAMNYDANANTDDGSCIAYVYGCMDATLNNDGTYAASNYAGPGNTLGANGTEQTPVANTDDGSCNAYNCPTISISQGLFNTVFKIYTKNTPYNQSGGSSSYWLNSGTNATIDGNGVTMNPWSSWVSGGNVVGVKTGEPTANYFTAGSTTVDIVFNVMTSDGNCSITDTQTFTIGCTDSTASNATGFDISDNTQCVYSGCTDALACNYYAAATTDDGSCAYCGDTNAVNHDGADPSCTSGCVYAGCMDATPQADGTGFAASNYDLTATTPCNTSDPLQGGTGPFDQSLDNECCTYYADESIIFGDPNATPGSNYDANTFFNVYYDIGSTGYTEAATILTLGSPSGTTDGVAGQSQYAMNSTSASRLAHTVVPGVGGAASGAQSEWHNYVNNGSLLVTSSIAMFSGACDNPSLNPPNELPQGNVMGPSRSYTVGCKNDGTAFNHDASLDLHLDGSCVAVNSGCMDASAWATVPSNNTATAAGLSGYDAAHNTACGTSGSTTDTTCCCFDTACDVFAALGATSYNSANQELTIPITLIPCARKYQYATRFYDGGWSGWTTVTDVPATQTTLGSIKEQVSVLWPSQYDNDAVTKQIKVRAVCTDADPTTYSPWQQANVTYTY